MLSIRDGKLIEVDAAVQLWDEASRTRDSRYANAEDFRERIGRRTALPGSTLLVARWQEIIVGTALLSQACADGGAGVPIRGVGHLGMVAVLPSFWGRGIGRTLMENVMSRARNHDYAIVQLWVHDTNLRARNLYASFGFVDAGESMKNCLGDIMRLQVTTIV